MPDWLMTIDGGILLWIQENLRCDWLSRFLIWYTNMGEAGVIWIIIALIMMIGRKTRKAGVMALVSMGLCFLLNDLVLKELVERLRPFHVVEGLTVLIQRPDSYSFPSGHSCSSFAAATTWFLLLKGRYAKAGKIFFLFMAAVMAASRLYVGVHFPTDVLAGTALGILGGYFWTKKLSPVYDRCAEKIKG